MSVVVIDNQTVHYEVIGRGRPVLFLHGWLGSWRYWLPTMETVSENFRTYSFDFLGFGSSQRKTMEENIRNYSHQVVRFLDSMGIDRVSLVGHSMGGMVAMKTALDYPQRVAHTVTVGAPFDGRSLSWLLKLTDNPTLAEAFARWSWLRRTSFRFYLGSTNDPGVRDIINEALMSKGETLRLTIGSMLRTDLRPELPSLMVPALIVHGGRDDVVSPNQLELFDGITMAEVLNMPRARHFPFFDRPAEFNEHLMQFLLRKPPTPHLAPEMRPFVKPVVSSTP
jgi:pimeloyl-ACP methyl ester carboxylesterase